MSAWWTQETAGMIGAIAGSGVGILGGLLGVLVGVVAPRGKAKPLVVGLQTLVAGAGVVTFFVGIYALSTGQPYAVWYPLMLLGVLGGAIFGGLLPLTLMTYRKAEARRIEAERLRRR